MRYRDWFRGTELAYFKAQKDKAEKNLIDAEKVIDTYSEEKDKLDARLEKAAKSLEAKQADYDKGLAKGLKMEKRTEELAKARARYAEAQENLSNLDKAYQEADASLESLKALLLAARIQVDRKAAEIKRYEDSNSGI